MAISAIRLHSTIPSITDNFHRALDDLEAEIVSKVTSRISSCAALI